jgi:hypothetical protein
MNKKLKKTNEILAKKIANRKKASKKTIKKVKPKKAKVKKPIKKLTIKEKKKILKKVIKKTIKKIKVVKKAVKKKAKTKAKKKISFAIKYNEPEVRFAARHFYRIQGHRIAIENQIRALKTNKLSTQPLDGYFIKLKDMETEIKERMVETLKDKPIWETFLKKVKGIGPVTASMLINLIQIEKAQYPSSLCKYAGMTPDSKRVKGKKLDYNPDMKVTMWKICKSFLMSSSPYRKFYDQRKALEVGRNKSRKKKEQLTKLHIHRRANRYMGKMFLKDLYLHWRPLEGLPVSDPYPVAKLNHKYDKSLDLYPIKKTKK